MLKASTLAIGYEVLVRDVVIGTGIPQTWIPCTVVNAMTPRA
jgi:hypothetical protein